MLPLILHGSITLIFLVGLLVRYVQTKAPAYKLYLYALTLKFLAFLTALTARLFDIFGTGGVVPFNSNRLYFQDKHVIFILLYLIAYSVNNVGGLVFNLTTLRIIGTWVRSMRDSHLCSEHKLDRGACTVKYVRPILIILAIMFIISLTLMTFLSIFSVVVLLLSELFYVLTQVWTVAVLLWIWLDWQWSTYRSDSATLKRQQMLRLLGIIALGWGNYSYMLETAQWFSVSMLVTQMVVVLWPRALCDYDMRPFFDDPTKERSFEHY